MNTQDLISSHESIEEIMQKHQKGRTFQLKSFSNKPEKKMNTRYNSNGATTRFSSINSNGFSTQTSLNVFRSSQEIPTFRVLAKDDPRTKSLNVDKLGCIDK